MARPPYDHPAKKGFSGFKLAVVAVAIVLVAYLLAVRFSDAGRFRSFASDFFPKLAVKLEPFVIEARNTHGTWRYSDQFHHTVWRKSRTPSDEDNSWGTYFHTIMIHFKDDPERYLFITIEMQFQEIPLGFTLPTGQDKGWARFGEVSVDSAFGYGFDGSQRIPTRIQHPAVSPERLKTLSDQITRAMYQ